MLETISQINDAVYSVVGGPVMVALLVGTGIWFTIRTKFFQLTKFRLWFSSTIVACFKHKEVRKTKDKRAISQFQSLCTALAGTVGTGNIAGVATAIVAGGPGAVFWMWVSAFFGMMTNFAEKVLGIKYRYKDKKGNWVGGAMIYIERGLKCKWLAVAFSVFCVLASFGIGNMSQGNSIAEAMNDSFQIPKWVSGLVAAALVAMVILGGIKRIARVTEKIVPIMAGFYIIGTLVVIGAHIENVPEAFGSIFREAFNFRAGVGGVAGYGIAVAMNKGVARGIFSNEAGLGSSVMVHSASDVKEPVVQGMWGIFEVFADTIVICTLTALTILCSGVYDQGVYEAALGTPAMESLANGSVLTNSAFATVFGPWGSVFTSIALTLFAFSTFLGWSYYGERGMEYLFGARAVPVYKILFIIMVFVGCVARLELVWSLSDTFNMLMALPNLAALLLLSKQAIDELKGYYARKRVYG